MRVGDTRKELCCVLYGCGGTPGKGIGTPGCVSSRMLRSLRHPAVTFWLCTVAAPCPLPAVRRKLSVPLGCAPASCAGCQSLLSILPKPQPGRANPLSRLFFASAAKIRYTMYNRATQQVFPTDIKSGAGCRKHFGKTAGGRGAGLAFCDVGQMFRSL